MVDNLILFLGLLMIVLVAIIAYRIGRQSRRTKIITVTELFPPLSDATRANSLLRDLDFVVFDTEATGLRPSVDDEMIQLAGVRIAKQKLLPNNHFDQFANPGREIPAKSTLIHGITDSMVIDALPPSQVLQQFSAYCKNSVLVAHCAAFDMALIGRYQNSEIIRFECPILDTMLLAYATDPSHLDLSLDTVAERFGIEIKGRHTALGDALATAEIFLTMLDPLEEIGIYTLEQAMDMCRRMSKRSEFRVSF